MTADVDVDVMNAVYFYMCLEYLPIPNLLLTNSAGLLLCYHTFHLLMEDPLLLDLHT